jgi:AcrR family transcriptional regulator
MPQLPAAEANVTEQKLRADAANNRRRILDAARAVYAERGIDAPLDEIARRAAVGNATLYRRFPTRHSLIAAVFEDRLAEYARVAEEALRAPDPWAGFCGFTERVCEMQAADRGLSDVLTLTFLAARGADTQLERAYDAFAELVRRAQAAGQLRPDFVTEDFILLIMANAGVVRGTGAAAPAVLKRFVALILDGCRAEGAHALPPPPPPAQLYKALRAAIGPRPA